METENTIATLSQWREKETLGHYQMQAGLSDKSAARLTSRAPHDSASVGCHGNDCRLCVGTAEHSSASLARQALRHAFVSVQTGTPLRADTL